jgi:ribosomal protein S18 acetylase RimI-like enzyme
MSLALLDNIAWNTLTGPHAAVATGAGAARRFAPGFSALLGFQDLSAPDFAAITPYCEPGEPIYCGGWSGTPPAGWRIEAETTMFQMVWTASQAPEDTAPDALRLSAEHVPQMLALAELTKPGPFGPRTIELGEYFGFVEGGRLLAMAGERMAAGPWHEVSGVCTQPDAQGRGLARRLMEKLVSRQLARGETPFLHVMRANERAWAMYERMGFQRHQELVVRVLSRTADEAAHGQA